jgi:hypothetical protein
MTTGRRLMILTIVAALVFVAPVVWSSFGTYGYFDGGRCMCGNTIYIRIHQDGYYDFSPGHKHKEELLFKLRARDGGWEMMGNDGAVIADLRLQGGELWERYSGTPTWSRYPRVHNIWRVWIAKTVESVRCSAWFNA